MKAELLNQLSRNEATLAAASTGSALSPPIVKTENRVGNAHSWPCIVKRHNRGSSPHSAWTSSGYWTTMYTYYQSTNDAIQRTGYAWPNRLVTAASTQNWGGAHREMYAKDNMAGCVIPIFASNTNSSYAPFTTNLMFIKNTDTSSRTLNVTSISSSYWSSGQDGSSCMAIVPNSSTKSSVTNVSFQSIWSRTGGAGVYVQSGSVSVAAGTTIALLQTSTADYKTSFSNGGHYEAVNLIGNIGSWDQYFQPDHDMHTAAFMCNHESAVMSPTSTTHISQNWPFCASVFGD
jgi:hypothetical protein